MLKNRKRDGALRTKVQLNLTREYFVKDHY